MSERRATLEPGARGEAQFVVGPADTARDAGPIGEGEHTRAVVATTRLVAGADRRRPGANSTPENRWSGRTDAE